jgi:tripartite-type tricarboxylate transporter receptor subunit TctC
MNHLAPVFVLVASVAAMTAGQACADGTADFYAGKRVTIITAGTPAGGYGVYARSLSLHLGKHIPGQPQVIVQFMPGAGGLVATNFVLNAAPKDGTAIGGVQRSVVRLALTGDKGVKYDAARINWIGSLNEDASVCVAWHTSGIRTIQEVMDKGLIIGGAGLNDTEQFPTVLNNTIGTKFKIISGYSGVGINLAMERGEVAGRCGWSWSSLKSQHGEWLRDHKINILVQIASKKHPELQAVPLATELTTSSEQRQILEFVFGEQALGQPYIMAESVPADRLAAMRKAFRDTAADKELRDELGKMGFDVALLDGEEMQRMVERMIRTPSSIIEQANAAAINKGR